MANQNQVLRNRPRRKTSVVGAALAAGIAFAPVAAQARTGGVVAHTPMMQTGFSAGHVAHFWAQPGQVNHPNATPVNHSVAGSLPLVAQQHRAPDVVHIAPVNHPHLGKHTPITIGEVQFPQASPNDVVLNVVNGSHHWLVKRSGQVTDANGKPVNASKITGTVTADPYGLVGFGPHDLKTLADMQGHYITLDTPHGAFNGQIDPVNSMSGNGGKIHSGSTGAQHNNKNTFVDSHKLNKAVPYVVIDGQNVSVKDLKPGTYKNVQIAVNTGIKNGNQPADDNGITMTGNVKVTEVNGKLQVSFNRAVDNAVRSVLNGDSTQKASPHEAGIKIPAADLNLYFANDATGSGNILANATTGKLTALAVTFKNNTKGEQQGTLLFKKDANGNYTVYATKATPRDVLLKSADMKIARGPDGQYHVVDPCGCKMEGGGHTKIVKTKIVNKYTQKISETEVVQYYNERGQFYFSAPVISISDVENNSYVTGMAAPIEVAAGNTQTPPAPPSPPVTSTPTPKPGTASSFVKTLAGHASTAVGGCVSLCTFEAWVQNTVATVNVRLATDEASIAALQAVQGQGGDNAVTQAIAAAQREEGVVDAAQVVAYAAQQQAGSAATTFDTGSYANVISHYQADRADTDAAIANISGFATPDAAVATIKADTDALKVDTANFETATKNFDAATAAAQKLSADQNARLRTSFDKFKHEAKTDNWIIGVPAFGALALAGAALWAVLRRPRGAILPPPGPVPAQIGAAPNAKQYNLAQDFQAAQAAVTQWAGMGAQADFAAKLSAEAALKALHNSVMRDRKDMNLAAQAADYLLDVESQFRGHLNMSDATEVFSFIKADQVQDRMLQTRVRAIQKIWAPAA